MAKYLKRLVGNYEQEELVVSISVFRIRTMAQAVFKDVFLEFRRRDKTERSAPLCTLRAGPGDYPINFMYNKLSVFYKQASGVSKGQNAPDAAVYQDKVVRLRMLGAHQETRETIFLGQKDLNLAQFCGMMEKQIEIDLDDGACKRTKLGLVISIMNKEQAGEKGMSAKDMRDANMVSMSVIECDDLDDEDAGEVIGPNASDLERMQSELTRQQSQLNKTKFMENELVRHVGELQRTVDQATLNPNVRASDLGRLRIKIEDNDEEIKILKKKLADLEQQKGLNSQDQQQQQQMQPSQQATATNVPQPPAYGQQPAPATTTAAPTPTGQIQPPVYGNIQPPVYGQ